MPASYIPPIDKTATQHEGSLKTTARLYQYDGPCVPISRHLIVKTGPFVDLTEAATLQFVAANTSVPVPRVHCAFVHKNQAYIVMERIRGRTLPDAWATLSEADLDHILAQLRRLLRELRSLPPPPGGEIKSCADGSLRDSRISRCRPRFRPLKTTQDFHLWLRDGLQPDDELQLTDEQERREIQEMMAVQDRHYPPPVFTHGDLNPFNIMVHGDQVVCIIDWEFAGRYPPYWEYTSEWGGNLTRPTWQGLIAKFLDPWPEELKMEMTRQRWWGEI